MSFHTFDSISALLSSIVTLTAVSRQAEICRASQRGFCLPAADSSMRSPNSSSEARKAHTRHKTRVHRELSGATGYQRFESFPHGGQGIAAGAQRTEPQGPHTKVASGSAATLGSRVAERRRDVALGLEAIEGPVNAPTVSARPVRCSISSRIGTPYASSPSRRTANRTMCSNSPRCSRAAICSA